MTHGVRLPSWLRYFFPRSLWVGLLFALLSCVSLISPQAQSPRPIQRKGRLRRLPAATLAHMRTRLAPHQEQKPPSERQRFGKQLGFAGEIPPLPLPDIDDVLILCYGIPVVPWLKRIGIRQWQNWLEHLGATLRARYPERDDITLGPAWEAWLERHVRYVESHFARIAGARIAQLLSALPQDFNEIYLFGHSAGGSAIMQYLADLRDGVAPAPSLPIRAVLTLNAAVAGPARFWTGWPIANERPALVDRVFPKLRKYLTLATARPEWHRQFSWGRDYLQLPFRGLGAWTRSQGIAMLTVSNNADLFGHQALDDVPYLALRIGRRSDLKRAFTGKTHLAIQRDPRVPRFLWWCGGV
jgi:pimeloyl-ACP methyl ester carboxylesterase